TSPYGGAMFNTGIPENAPIPVVNNSIFYGNNSGVEEDPFSSTTFTYSLVQGLSGGSNGNLDGSITLTLFSDAANGDYTLREAADNPAINAGDPTTNMNLFPMDQDNQSIDLAGNPRLKGGT